MKQLIDIASSYIGTTEIRGAQDNPKIVAMFAKSGAKWVDDDETPWCAAFVGTVLADAGIKGTMKLNARSYLEWGTPVDEPQEGDVVILWRGKKNGWQGHVAFFVRFDRGSVVLLGGNQADKVGINTYKKDRVLGYRRAPQLAVPKGTVSKAGAYGLVAVIAAGLAKFFGG